MSLKKTIEVFVGIPSLRDRDEYAESFRGTCITHIKNQECPVKILEPYVTPPYSGKWKRGDKSRLRAITDRLNNIVNKFMSTKATHLWLVNLDIEVPRHALCALLKLDVDLASGIYSAHKHRRMMTFGRIPDPEFYNYAPRDIGYFRGKVLGENEMVSGGDGCLLIKRRVFKRYHSRIPALRFIVTPDGKGSDMYFWWQAQKAGFTARIHGGVLCGHRPQHPLSVIGDYQW